MSSCVLLLITLLRWCLLLWAHREKWGRTGKAGWGLWIWMWELHLKSSFNNCYLCTCSQSYKIAESGKNKQNRVSSKTLELCYYWGFYYNIYIWALWVSVGMLIRCMPCRQLDWADDSSLQHVLDWGLYEGLETALPQWAFNCYCGRSP